MGYVDLAPNSLLHAMASSPKPDPLKVRGVTCQEWLGLHLQPDLDQVHRAPHAHGHQTSHHAGEHLVQHATGPPGIAMAKLAEEPLRIAEDAEHHRVVERDAGQGEGESFEEAMNLSNGGTEKETAGGYRQCWPRDEFRNNWKSVERSIFAPPQHHE